MAVMKQVATKINKITRQQHLHHLMYGEVRLHRTAPLAERLTGLPFDAETLGELLEHVEEAALVQDKSKHSSRHLLFFPRYVLSCKRRENDELAVKEHYDLTRYRCKALDKSTLQLVPEVENTPNVVAECSTFTLKSGDANLLIEQLGLSEAKDLNALIAATAVSTGPLLPGPNTLNTPGNPPASDEAASPSAGRKPRGIGARIVAARDRVFSGGKASAAAKTQAQMVNQRRGTTPTGGTASPSSLATETKPSTSPSTHEGGNITPTAEIGRSNSRTSGSGSIHLEGIQNFMESVADDPDGEVAVEDDDSAALELAGINPPEVGLRGGGAWGVVDMDSALAHLVGKGCFVHVLFMLFTYPSTTLAEQEQEAIQEYIQTQQRLRSQLTELQSENERLQRELVHIHSENERLRGEKVVNKYLQPEGGSAANDGNHANHTTATLVRCLGFLKLNDERGIGFKL